MISPYVYSKTAEYTLNAREIMKRVSCVDSDDFQGLSHVFGQESPYEAHRNGQYDCLGIIARDMFQSL